MWSFELLSEVSPATMEKTQAGSVIAQNISFSLLDEVAIFRLRPAAAYPEDA